MFNLRKAGEEITALKQHIEGQDTKLQQAHGKIGTLSEAITQMTEKMQEVSGNSGQLKDETEQLKQQLADETKRADTAEAALKEAKGEHETIEARIETEATLKATQQLAVNGGDPVTNTNDGGDSTPDNVVTKENFWKVRSEQPPRSRSKWYQANKHIIGK